MIIVDKSSFKFIVSDEHFARELYVKWDGFCRVNFENIVNEVLSKYDYDDSLIQIDLLKLDLGNIAEKEFYTQFPMRLKKELERHVLSVSFQKNNQLTQTSTTKPLRNYELQQKNLLAQVQSRALFLRPALRYKGGGNMTQNGGVVPFIPCAACTASSLHRILKESFKAKEFCNGLTKHRLDNFQFFLLNGYPLEYYSDKIINVTDEICFVIDVYPNEFVDFLIKNRSNTVVCERLVLQLEDELLIRLIGLFAHNQIEFICLFVYWLLHNESLVENFSCFTRNLIWKIALQYLQKESYSDTREIIVVQVLNQLLKQTNGVFEEKNIVFEQADNTFKQKQADNNVFEQKLRLLIEQLLISLNVSLKGEISYEQNTIENAVLLENTTLSLKERRSRFSEFLQLNPIGIIDYIRQCKDSVHVENLINLLDFALIEQLILSTTHLHSTFIINLIKWMRNNYNSFEPAIHPTQEHYDIAILKSVIAILQETTFLSKTKAEISSYFSSYIYQNNNITKTAMSTYINDVSSAFLSLLQKRSLLVMTREEITLYLFSCMSEYQNSLQLESLITHNQTKTEQEIKTVLETLISKNKLFSKEYQNNKKIDEYSLDDIYELLKNDSVKSTIEIALLRNFLEYPNKRYALLQLLTEQKHAKLLQIISAEDSQVSFINETEKLFEIVGKISFSIKSITIKRTLHDCTIFLILQNETSKNNILNLFLQEMSIYCNCTAMELMEIILQNIDRTNFNQCQNVYNYLEAQFSLDISKTAIEYDSLFVQKIKEYTSYEVIISYLTTGELICKENQYNFSVCELYQTIADDNTVERLILDLEKTKMSDIHVATSEQVRLHAIFLLRLLHRNKEQFLGYNALIALLDSVDKAKTTIAIYPLRKMIIALLSNKKQAFLETLQFVLKGTSLNIKRELQKKQIAILFSRFKLDYDSIRTSRQYSSVAFTLDTLHLNRYTSSLYQRSYSVLKSSNFTENFIEEQPLDHSEEFLLTIDAFFQFWQQEKLATLTKETLFSTIKRILLRGDTQRLREYWLKSSDNQQNILLETLNNQPSFQLLWIKHIGTPILHLLAEEWLYLQASLPILKTKETIVYELLSKMSSNSRISIPENKYATQLANNLLQILKSDEKLLFLKAINNQIVKLPNLGKAIKDIFSNKYENNSEKFDAISVLQINNAGLTLISPWLPRLFKMLGFLTENGKEFNNTEAKIRAIFILQRILYSDDNRAYHESELVFNRLLTNCPFNVPLPKALDLTIQEKDCVDSMLEGVKQNWDKLKNTSINGFQESFLRRSGQIRQEEDKWIVQVDSKVYDMLLDSLPWSFSLIRYSWLKKPINVIWIKQHY